MRMTELDDEELLVRYASGGSEAAFASLAARYVNLVFSAALRFTGDAHHAEEITQAVFVILARKAGSLRRGTVLSGWLYQTARLTAANFVKGEIRRRRREQEAYMQSTLTEPDAATWQQVAPKLDEAMGRLSEADRNAVVLRYFENKTSQEVAVTLKITEAAAHKRVSRAVDRLRTFLTTTALAGAVAANSVQAAPAGVAATVAAAAKGTMISATITTLVEGTMKTMTWLKLKFAAGIGAATLLAAGAGVAGMMRIGVGTPPAGPAPQTEVVFWQAIVDTPTFERLFPAQPPAGGTNDYQLRRIQFDVLLETLQSAANDGNFVDCGDRMIWLERQGGGWPFRQTKSLFGSASLVSRNAQRSEQNGTAMVNGFVNFRSNARQADLELDCYWSVNFTQFDAHGFPAHTGGAHSTRNENWTGAIPTGEAVCFEAGLTGDYKPAGLHHLAVFQAVAAPADLADDLRGETSITRWLAGGPEAALKNIRLAREWARDAAPAAYLSGEHAVAVTAGTIAKVVAIGQPSRWPGFWWDTNGLPVKADPHWGEAFPDAAFEVVLSLAPGIGTTDVSARTSDGSPVSFNSGSSRDPWNTFSIGNGIDKDLQRRLETAGHVDVALNHGIGEWQEIGVIHAGESNAIDGGTFALEPIDSRVGPSQIHIHFHFAYDPAWDVTLAAVDKRGHRTVFSGGIGMGQLSKRENRELYGFLDADKKAVDHLSILKRPVKEDVLPNIATMPRTPIPSDGPANPPANGAATNSGR
jgi:RNA polymerase sigma factor (sigma-70 family)